MTDLQSYFQSLDEVYGVAEWFGREQSLWDQPAYWCCQRQILQRYIWELLFYDQVTFSLKGEYGQFMSMEQAGALTEQLHDLIVSILRDMMAIDARYIEEVRFLRNDIFILHREPSEEEEDDIGVIPHEPDHQLLGYY